MPDYEAHCTFCEYSCTSTSVSEAAAGLKAHILNIHPVDADRVMQAALDSFCLRMVFSGLHKKKGG